MLILATRIHRLEQMTIPAEHPCTVCGAPFGQRLFTVHMVGYDPPSDTPARCSGCGRRQVWKIEFDQRG